jgi:hypothetical protein
MSKKTFIRWLVIAALAHLLLLPACSDSIDDPDNSDTVIRIESIGPNPVVSDIGQAIPTSDIVQVTVAGVSRSNDGSDITTVALDNYTIDYDPALETTQGPIDALNSPMTEVVSAGGSVTFDAVAVPDHVKDDGLTPATINATITVAGRDLADNPAEASARFQIILSVIPIDTDGDTIPDDEDNCPDIPNQTQTDTDTDGYGDVCDNCPFTDNPDQRDSDGDGIGDVCEP